MMVGRIMARKLIRRTTADTIRSVDDNFACTTPGFGGHVAEEGIVWAIVEGIGRMTLAKKEIGIN
jgi:hypothetical protein